jgi:hypothetical protein
LWASIISKTESGIVSERALAGTASAGAGVSVIWGFLDAVRRGVLRTRLALAMDFNPFDG